MRSLAARVSWQCLTGFAAVLASLLLGVLLSALPRQQIAAAGWVQHTLEVLGAATGLEADIEATTSEGRGFLLTRLPEDRARAEGAAARASAQLATLRALTADSPGQQATLDRLQPLLAERLAGLRAKMDLVAAGQGDPAELSQRTAANGRLTAEIHDLVTLFKTHERQLLTLRETAAARANRRTEAGAVGCAVVLAACGAALLAMLRQRQRSAQRHLVELEDRVRARTADLAASERRQRDYFRKVPFALNFLRRGGDGRFLIEDVNPAFEAMYGFVREDIIGRAVTDLWPADDASDMAQRFDACVASGQRLDYAAVRRVRGTPREFDIILAPFHNAAGEVDQLLACAKDVTEQRALERRIIAQAEAQAAAAERETALFQTSPDAMSILRVLDEPSRPGFVYESCNPALARLLGRPPDALIGQRPEDCLPPDLAAGLLDRLRRCIAAGGHITETATLPLPGGPRTFDLALTPLHDPASGRLQRIASVGRDVTERMQMQAALMQSQKLEAIGRLAAGVAHDFNNLLQAIVSCLELGLDDAAAGSPQQEFMEMALQSAKRGSHLTHHLLSYARQQILRPQVIELPAALAEMQHLLGRTLGPHIAVTVAVDAATPPVQVDRGQLDAALLNLAINAAAAMPQGGALALRARQLWDAETRWVALTVTDTGCGMDAATLAQATEPFFTTKGADGTGLGLPMVQGFVEQSGGRFRISSRLGEGTTVELLFPPATAHAAAEPPRTAALHGPGRVLLVDDSPDVLLTTAAFLANAGLEVVQTDNGVKALVMLAADDRFDVLLCDYAMPSMNGFDLIAEARLLVPNLAALIISGFAGVEAARALPAGVPVLHKPFMREDLLAALAAVLRGRTPLPPLNAARRLPRVSPAAALKLPPASPRERV